MNRKDSKKRRIEQQGSSELPPLKKLRVDSPPFYNNSKGTYELPHLPLIQHEINNGIVFNYYLYKILNLYGDRYLFIATFSFIP